MVHLIENICVENVKVTKRAAMYYKTEPFFVNVNDYVHTNNWEILQAIRILNSKGYSVDLIDRDNSNWNPSQPYDLFLGLGVGNSGRHFVRHAQASRAPQKVLLSMGPQPDVSNLLVKQRYSMFEERTGFHAPPMRTVDLVSGQNFIDIINTADFVFNIGERGTPSYNSFIKYGKPVLNFYPSISPAVQFNSGWLETRDPSSFLCFAGNGFICKGVDLVVESFLKTPDKKLHICGPHSERAFFEYYGHLINNAPNITYHGFITPGADVFNKLAANCSFVIFHSAAEGCCTSVATAIKAGVVPIINPWTGILVEDGKDGIVLDEGGDIIASITAACAKASTINQEDYKAMVDNTLEKSSLFSQQSFTDSYSEALDSVIGRNNENHL